VKFLRLNAKISDIEVPDVGKTLLQLSL